jgi:hypothetical protein
MQQFYGCCLQPCNGKVYLVSGYNAGFVDSAQPDTREFNPVTGTSRIGRTSHIQRVASPPV